MTLAPLLVLQCSFPCAVSADKATVAAVARHSIATGIAAVVTPMRTVYSVIKGCTIVTH